jgi:hypothetical protein
MVAPWLKWRRGMAISWEDKRAERRRRPDRTVANSVNRRGSPLRRDGYLASMLAVLVR